MAKNAVRNGHVVPFTAPAGGVISGVPVVIGALFVIPAVSAAAGEMFEGHLTGEWSLPKTAADTPAQGAAAYWNDTSDTVTTTSTGNRLIGAFTAAYANGTTTANVRLNGIAVV